LLNEAVERCALMGANAADHRIRASSCYYRGVMARTLIRLPVGSLGTLTYRCPFKGIVPKLRARNCIVRWKAARQRFVSRCVHKTSMSSLARAAVVVVAVLLLAAGALYWFRRDSAAPPTMASAPKSAAVPPATAAKPSEGGDVTVKTEAPPRTEGKKASPAMDPGISLQTGEVLEYTADVAKVSNVANLRLQVAERRNFLGKSAWHLQAFAHTQNPLRMVFELDDQFDSYSDAASMASLQYEMHLSERGQKVDSVQRMTVTGKEPAPANAAETRVLPGTRDPIGMLQYLRHIDWSQTREVRGPVYDGRKLYDVQATLAGASESVMVPAGGYRATKVDIRVFDGGTEMKDAHFSVYFAQNARRIPVLLEAVMPWTTARVELKSSK
jgi:hypothetical protein